MNKNIEYDKFKFNYIKEEILTYYDVNIYLWAFNNLSVNINYITQKIKMK